jgi:hypothetical protein
VRKHYSIPDDGQSYKKLWLFRMIKCPPWQYREFRMPRIPKIIDRMIPLSMGPGGSLCACCFDAPGSYGRKKRLKIARRKAKRMMMNEQLEYLEQVDL